MRSRSRPTTSSIRRWPRPSSTRRSRRRPSRCAKMGGKPKQPKPVTPPPRRRRSRRRRRRRLRPRAADDAAERRRGEEVHGLLHTPVDESRPNAPIPVRAKLGCDVGATRVFLFFRGSGQEDFLSVPMKNTSGAEWVGVIPGDAVTGKSLQYYLEARDARGRAVVNAGSGPSPFVVVISDTRGGAVERARGRRRGSAHEGAARQEAQGRGAQVDARPPVHLRHARIRLRRRAGGQSHRGGLAVPDAGRPT